MQQSGGAEYPLIWHMFAYRPAATEHLGAVHAGDPARAGADQSGDARADRGVHFVSQRLSVLTEVACRGRGGIAGR